MGSRHSTATNPEDSNINPPQTTLNVPVTTDPICEKMRMSLEDLQLIRDSFMQDMSKGWELGHGRGADAKQSSLKMISSHINVLPSGDEKGMFFAVDLGGTNLRILRVCLADGKSTIREYREAIPARVMSKSASADDLFGFIASACAELCKDLDTQDYIARGGIPLGFTFSFPCSQSSVKSGKLLEWTKGFETSGCVGQDPAGLLQRALDAQNLPLQVDALCNDTVGTLMTNAYTKKSPNCRIGVILGTGTNAAYSDPKLDDLIINIEWGGFDKNLKRSIIDEQIDAESPNPGKQFLEKMVSGLYLGELVRLGVLHELGRKKKFEHAFSHIEIPHVLTQINGIDTAAVSHLLESSDNLDSSLKDIEDPLIVSVLREVSECVIDRSAAVASAALAAVIQRATAGKTTSGCEVGIDGSLFTKGHNYKQRLLAHLKKLIPESEFNGIHLDFSEDGSGLGAALVAAAIARGKQVENIHRAG